MTDTPMSRHTPEPWDVQEGRSLLHVETRIDNPAGGGIAICSVPKSKTADADRIVAAVNATAGLDNPENEIRAMAEDIAYGNHPTNFVRNIARRWLDAHKETK